MLESKLALLSKVRGLAILIANNEAPRVPKDDHGLVGHGGLPRHAGIQERIMQDFNMILQLRVEMTCRGCMPNDTSRVGQRVRWLGYKSVAKLACGLLMHGQAHLDLASDGNLC